MMKNDDLGSLYEIPAMCGRGSALAVEKAFWTLLLANANSFFAAGNNNYISGATTNLSQRRLGAGRGCCSATRSIRRTTPSCSLRNTSLIPTSLEETAWELFKSTNVMIAGSHRPIASDAEHLRRLVPAVHHAVPEQRDACPAAATAAWYLFGEPGDVAAFGIAYLDGNEMPTIQDAPQNPDVLGIGWRVFFDFGVCQLDPRGEVKSKGAA